MFIIDGGNGDVFDFELSDKNGNKHYYEIFAENLQVAVRTAQKLYTKEYGNKATHLERNVIGFPRTSIV